MTEQLSLSRKPRQIKNNGKIAGFGRASLQPQGDSKLTSVGLAVEDAICVTPETPVSTVDDQMRVNDWNAVFVKDGDDVVGLITRWDAGLKSYRDARSLTAGNIMTAAKFSDGVLTIVICQ